MILRQFYQLEWGGGAERVIYVQTRFFLKFKELSNTHAESASGTCITSSLKVWAGKVSNTDLFTELPRTGTLINILY